MRTSVLKDNKSNDTVEKVAPIQSTARIPLFSFLLCIIIATLVSIISTLFLVRSEIASNMAANKPVFLSLDTKSLMLQFTSQFDGDVDEVEFIEKLTQFTQDMDEVLSSYVANSVVVLEGSLVLTGAKDITDDVFKLTRSKLAHAASTSPPVVFGGDE